MRSLRFRSVAPFALAGLVASMLASVPAWAQALGAWPQFQGGAGHPGASAGGPAPPYRQAWRFVSPDGAVSGAVIEDDVAIAVGSRTVYGIDVATGKEMWTLSRNGGPISIPAVGSRAGHRILVFVEEGAGGRTSLVGVDLDTRRERWRTPLEASSVADVTVEGPTAFVGDVEGSVYAVNLATGEIRWTADAGGRIEGTVAVADGRVFVSVPDPAARTVTVRAFEVAGGSSPWSAAQPVGSTAATIPAADEGTVVVGSSDRVVRGLDDSSGATRWESVALSPFFTANGAALDEGSAYIADLSGGIYRLDAGDGARVWDHQLNDRVVRSSPVVSGSAVLIGLNDGRLVALDATDGDLVWESAPSEGLIGAIAVSPRVVIAVKGGSRPGLIAYEHDPEGHLVDARSPTIPQPGTLAANFAIAFVACLIVISVPFRLVRDRLGPVDAEVDGDLDEEEDRGDEEP